MTFRSRTGLVVLLLTLAGMLPLPGCDSGSSPSPNSASGTGAAEPHARTPTAASSAKPTGFCEGWETPAVAFAVTGQMHGYLEPCGCSEPQYGGVPRRASLIQQMRDRGWPVAALDLGGTLKSTRKQSEFKFQTLMNMLRDMRYEALALGVEELRLGPLWLLSQHVDDPDHPEKNLKFLAANIVLFGSPDTGTPVPFKIFQAGTKKVAVTAVFDPAMAATVGMLNKEEVDVQPVDAPLKKAITAMQEQKPDLMVLMIHGSKGFSLDLAKRYPEFPLMLSTSPSEDPIADNPSQIGAVTLVQVGHKGKKVTVLGWYPDNAEKPFQHEQVQLDGTRFPDAEPMLAQIRTYQAILESEKLAANEPALRHPAGGQFVGADKCGECHTKAYAKWKETGHAQAFESIRNGRLGIPRQFDPECISCHTTGWHPQDVFRYESGFASEAMTPHLLGNQCENCHGPGSRHIELIEAGMTEEARKLTHLSLDDVKKSHCYSCHDLDNSPHFNFDEYWPKIAHPGLD